MLKTLYSSKIRQKQFYWTLVTKTVVHCLFAFGRLSFIFLKLNKKYSLSDRSTFSPRNCAITQFQIMKLYHLTPASMVYICFEVSIFCVYLYGVSHSVFAHKPGNVEQTSQLLPGSIWIYKGKAGWYFLIIIISTGVENKAIDKLRGWQQFCLFAFMHVSFGKSDSNLVECIELHLFR